MLVPKDQLDLEQKILSGLGFSIPPTPKPFRTCFLDQSVLIVLLESDGKLCWACCQVILCGAQAVDMLRVSGCCYLCSGKENRICHTRGTLRMGGSFRGSERRMTRSIWAWVEYSSFERTMNPSTDNPALNVRWLV